MIETRAKFLRQFDQYVRNLNISDMLFMKWLTCGVPDGADDKQLLEMAKDDRVWLDVVNLFASICQIAGVLD